MTRRRTIGDIFGLLFMMAVQLVCSWIINRSIVRSDLDWRMKTDRDDLKCEDFGINFCLSRGNVK